jgi:pimeloyl-ACP methyl ester carboxylesterase
MPFADSKGVQLYYEEAGSGFPIVFVHEFAHDMRSWEPQLRYFSRRYRCIAYNGRGYPPSDVPPSAWQYSQAIATDDIANVMRHLGIRKAHIIGCSMGGYATLHFGLRYAGMARSITVIGAGYGSDPDKRAQFLRDTEVMARRFEDLGTPEAIKVYQVGPRACSSRTRTRARSGNSARSSRGTRRSARPTRCAACRRSARRSIASSAASGGWRCRRTSSPATRTTTASSREYSSSGRARRRV